MNVLMVGVDKNRVGGMWTVAETFINNEWFNQKVNLYYVATATGGSKIKRIGKMLEGYCKAIKIFASKKPPSGREVRLSKNHILGLLNV